MSLEVWIPVLVLVAIATVTDLLHRRIPNWLTLPLLVGGVVQNGRTLGISGVAVSLEGIGVAVATLGTLCWLDTMGLGDLKLGAAIGAWVGPSALGMTLLISAMAGGIFAVSYAAYRGQWGLLLDKTAAIVSGKPGCPDLGVTHPHALTIPYAPAIATGTLFSFLAYQG